MSEKQDTLPTILLLEKDEETRRLLVHNLHNRGYHVIVVLDEEGAIARVRGGRDPINVILINQVGLSVDEYMNLGRYIRQSAKLPSDTPIIVIAEQYGEDMEGKDVKVGECEYMTYLEDGEQLMNLLYRLARVKVGGDGGYLTCN